MGKRRDKGKLALQPCGDVIEREGHGRRKISAKAFVRCGSHRERYRICNGAVHLLFTDFFAKAKLARKEGGGIAILTLLSFNFDILVGSRMAPLTKDVFNRIVEMRRGRHAQLARLRR